jgi:hypothetical protein
VQLEHKATFLAKYKVLPDPLTRAGTHPIVDELMHKYRRILKDPKCCIYVNFTKTWNAWIEGYGFLKYGPNPVITFKDGVFIKRKQAMEQLGFGFITIYESCWEHDATLVEAELHRRLHSRAWPFRLHQIIGAGRKGLGSPPGRYKVSLTYVSDLRLHTFVSLCEVDSTHR